MEGIDSMNQVLRIENLTKEFKKSVKPHYRLSEYPLKSSSLKSKLTELVIHMGRVGLKPNTIDGYRRLGTVKI